MKTNLRQAEAKVNVSGIVSGIDLSVSKDDKGVDQISGTVSIKTSEFNIIPFKVWVKSKKSDGTPNKQYPGIETVMNEYKSIAQYGLDEADIVTVSGTISPYEGRNGFGISYRSNFFNRFRGPKENFESKSEFDLEMYVNAIVPEMVKKGEDIEESGRLIIKGWMPTYNGIEPIEAVVPEDLADPIQDLYSPGDTINIWGEIVNARIVENKSKTGAFGEAKKKVESTFINELVVTGGDNPYDEDNKLHYDKEVIYAAVQERDNEREAAKANATNARTTNKPSGTAYGRRLENF